jgi:hypothetical protein
MLNLRNHHPGRLLASGGLALSMLVGGIATPAATLASGGGSAVSVIGHCTSAATSKLKAKHDSGRIEIEFQVDQNRNNRAWRVTISDNGSRIFSGIAVTRAPSGSFTVHRLTANRAGLDTIRARAVNLTSGAVCTATLKV